MSERTSDGQNAGVEGPAGETAGRFRIVVHGLDPVPQIVDIGPAERGSDLLARLLEESRVVTADLALQLRDADEEIDLNIVLAVAVREGDHLYVHKHKCREIDVDVRFAGHSPKAHKFSASATIGRVLSWAEREFEIIPAQRGQYRLKLSDVSEYLDNDLLLGEIVTKEPCSLRVDLVRAEQNAGATAAEVLIKHLSEMPFRRGFVNGRWRSACIDFPIVTISVATGQPEPVWIGLRLDLSGYPNTAPQGVFWDIEHNVRLPDARWPILQEDNKAFRVDWAGGNGLYIACDRSALMPGPGHPEWATTFPNTNWQPEIGIARYLSVVYGLLKIAYFCVVA